MICHCERTLRSDLRAICNGLKLDTYLGLCNPGGFALISDFLVHHVLRLTRIPNGSPISRICCRTSSMSSHNGGAGNAGAALRGRTIKFITMKTPNPYRIEPTMTLRRRSGI